MTAVSAQTLGKMKLELGCLKYIVIFVAQINIGIPGP